MKGYETCANCTFYVPVQPSEDGKHSVGDCHRYPPKSYNPCLPETESINFCGEFKPNTATFEALAKGEMPQ